MHFFQQHQRKILNRVLDHKTLIPANKHIKGFSTHIKEKVFSKTCKDTADGSDTPANHMTGNLLKTENGNNEEQQHTYV